MTAARTPGEEADDAMIDGLRRHISPVAAEALEAADPEFAAVTEALFGHPYRRSVLSPRIRALVVLAVEAVIPQADEARLRAAIEAAIEAGASKDEAICILEISCSIGLHSVSVGLPILEEEMAALGQSLPDVDEHRARLKAKFEASGPRPRPLNPIYTAILRIDPDYFVHRVAFIDLPWTRLETLDPEVKHLASIAIDAVSPQHYVDGLRKHIRESLAIGVTPEAILEVFELISVTGLRTLDVGMPLVADLF